MRNKVLYKTVNLNGVKIFYRESGNKNHPSILLFHGFPASSHMYRNLIEELAHEYHIIAPDFPAFGNSDQPHPNEFEYTFDNLANVMNDFVMLNAITNDPAPRGAIEPASHMLKQVLSN